MANIESAVAYMERIAADDSHGYAQDNRGGNPDFDCSSLVGTALNQAGFNVKKLSTTRDLYDQCKKCGFIEVGINESRKRGDIFLTPGKHVVMCTDSNFIVHASINSKGTAKGDLPGDQTGKEICKRSFYYPSYGWTYHLRYNSSTSVNNSDFSVGIDVSKYQGIIDWKEVKSSGVSFAILKITDKNNNVEESFERNYTNCINAGVEIKGVYNYSYATNTSEAIKAAKSVINILNKRKTTVWLDVEDKCQQGIGARLIDIINAYKQTIESAGLDFGIYTGQSFYNSYIKPYMGQNNYKFWIARYGKNDGQFNESYKPNIQNMVCWQYTSKNILPGISGYVDTNVWYNNVIIKDTNIDKNTKIGKITANILNIRSTYSTDGDVLGKYTKNNIVKILDCKNNWYKTEKGWISGEYVTTKVSGKVVNCNKLNIRKEPNKDTNNILFAIQKNTIVQINDISNDDKWINVVVNNVIGWCSKDYIEYL